MNLAVNLSDGNSRQWYSNTVNNDSTRITQGQRSRVAAGEVRAVILANAYLLITSIGSRGLRFDTLATLLS